MPDRNYRLIIILTADELNFIVLHPPIVRRDYENFIYLLRCGKLD